MEIDRGQQQQTFWCHDCDMSVSLPTTTSIACPVCFSDLLELMDSTSRHEEDNYRLNSPVLQRLIHRLSGEDDVAPPTTNIYLLPASKDYVDVIPTVKMTSSSVCAVCKEAFAEDAEGKQLACSHVYHPECILPWLSSRSSCPVCRYQLPTDTPALEQHHIQRLVHYRLQLQLHHSSFN